MQTLCLIPFARYSASKISVSDLDLSESPKVKYFLFFRKLLCNFIMAFCWYELSISYRLPDIPLLRFQLVTLTVSGSPKVKYVYFFRKLICNFLMVFYWYEFSISYRLRDIIRI